MTRTPRWARSLSALLLLTLEPSFCLAAASAAPERPSEAPRPWATDLQRRRAFSTTCTP